MGLKYFETGLISHNWGIPNPVKTVAKAAGSAAKKVAQTPQKIGGNIGSSIGGALGNKNLGRGLGSAMGASLVPTAGPMLYLNDKFNQMKGKPIPDAPGEGQQTDYLSLINKTKEELGKSQQEAQRQEDLLKGQMLSAAQKSNEAIDAQLAQLIDQTGFVTGLQNQSIGAAQADRGTLRSGQTALQLQNQQLRKQGAIGSAVEQSEQQKRQIEQQVTQAQQGIADRRKQIENQMKIAELGAYTDLQQNKELQGINQQFQSYIQNLNASAQQKQDLMGIIGSLGMAGGVMAGYGIGGNGIKNNVGTANTAGTSNAPKWNLGDTAQAQPMSQAKA
jgi:hypothetical protein